MDGQRRVLVVDDDLDVLYYVDDVLRELGCRPIKATSIDDAADIVGALSVDAVIAGFDTIARGTRQSLEQLAALGFIPVLIMAGQERDRFPEGEPSPLRHFTDYPPDLTELERVLGHCASVSPARAAR